MNRLLDRPAGRAPAAGLVALTSLLCLWGCTPTEAPQITTIEGAQFLSLRCVQETADGLVGLPLQGCGCTTVEGEGAERRLRRMGGVECRCEAVRATADGGRVLGTVRSVKARCTPITDAQGCVTDWTDCTDSPGVGASGDWVPADLAEEPLRVVGDGFVVDAACAVAPARPSVSCVPAGSGQLRGYVGSGGTGRLTVLDLTAGEAADSDVDPKRILDVDLSIPGITAVFVDDLISDVISHPLGDYVATVNSTTGSLTVISDEGQVSNNLRVELGVAPLLSAVTWPPVDAVAPDYEQPPMAWIAAPGAGLVLPVALDRLADPEAADVLGPPIPVTSPDGSPAAPARMAVSPDGKTLFVGHARAPVISVVELDPMTGAGAERGWIELAGASECADGYLVRRVSVTDDASCRNGLDDDGDGAVDAADPDCGDALGSEAAIAGCPKRPQCGDGADNDGDGLIDLDDPDCAIDGCADPAACALAVDWEGPVPACADGQDNDGDGLVDRADPDCRNEADDDEAAAPGAEVGHCALAPQVCGQPGAPSWCAEAERRCGLPSCQDGDDNDGDGQTDLDDSDCAACQDPAACLEGRGLPQVGDDDPCYNGEDDDLDGLVDGEDPGCGDVNAAARFGFERATRCSDGIDNDGDGLVDLDDVGDCYAASDDSESPAAERVGPRQLVVAHVPLPAGVRRFLYVLESRGSLVRLDLDDAAARPERVSLPSAAQAMALRQYDDEASLLVIGADTTLRSVEITGPTPVLTDDGQPVFVRLYEGEADGERATRVRAYTVDEGVAVDVAPVEGTFGFEDLVDEGVIWRVADGDTSPVFVRTSRPEGAEDIRAGAPAAPGNDDLQLVLPLSQRQVVHAQANLLGSAFARTNMLTAAPRLLVNDNQVSLDRARHALFCLPDGDEADAGACVPAGSTADGSLETAELAAARDPDRIEPVPAVQVIESDPERLVAGTYTAAYEGELPRTESRTGLHGGRIQVTDLNGEAAEGWTLVDYEADFCARGVEVGDVVLIDRFRAATIEAGESELCQPFEPALAQNPSLAREPLRYQVVALTRRKLVLAPDVRTTYCLTDDDGVERCQLPRGPREPAPSLAPPPAAPPFVCAAQFVNYRVRVGHDQWLLTGNRSGYRHPWIASGGECVVDDGRLAAGRVGRFRLGDRFENEWFRFRLGTWAGSGGVPTDALPHLIDAAWQFDVRVGAQSQGLVDAAIVPQAMRWSPGDDRLYVVDTALETVAEIGGLAIYEQALQVIRRLQ